MDLKYDSIVLCHDGVHEELNAYSFLTAIYLENIIF